jgi:hypothetical protein
MHHNDARRAFSCPGGDSFIGGNVISDRFNRFCLPPDLRLKGHTQRTSAKVQGRLFRLIKQAEAVRRPSVLERALRQSQSDR